MGAWEPLSSRSLGIVSGHPSRLCQTLGSRTNSHLAALPRTSPPPGCLERGRWAVSAAASPPRGGRCFLRPAELGRGGRLNSCRFVFSLHLPSSFPKPCLVDETHSPTVCRVGRRGFSQWTSAPSVLSVAHPTCTESPELCYNVRFWVPSRPSVWEPPGF